MKKRIGFGLSLLLSAVVGCTTERNHFWSTSVNASSAYGLQDRVVMLDTSAQRALSLSVDENENLQTSFFSIEPGYRGAYVDKKQNALYVLADGDPLAKPKALGPSFTVYKSGGEQTKYAFSQKFSSATLVADPLGQIALVHASDFNSNSTTKGVVGVNANQIVLMALDRPPQEDNPRLISVRSFGSALRRANLSRPVAFPGQTQRLLLALTGGELALMNVENPQATETTVRLFGEIPRSGDPVSLSPVDVTSCPQNGALTVAVRVANQRNLVVVKVSDPSDTGYKTAINLIELSATPTDMLIVPGGSEPQVFAPMAAKNALAVIDTEQGTSTDVDLGAAFERITPTEDDVTPNGTAVLWSTKDKIAGLLDLKAVRETPYRSLKKLNITHTVAAVKTIAVGNEKFAVLIGSEFEARYTVVNLKTSAAVPLNGAFNDQGTLQTPWLWSKSSTQAFQTALPSLQTQPVSFPYSIQSIFDVQRPGGGQSSIAILNGGGGAVSIVNPVSLDAQPAAVGLFLEGAP